MPVIHLEQLRFRWPNQTLDSLTVSELHIRRGEHVFIRGSSGSGKTTLLNLLAGIMLPTSGKLQLLGQDLTQLSSTARDRFRADHIGLIFQQFNLLPYLSVLENVQLPCHFSKRRRQCAEPLQQRSEALILQLGLEAALFKQAVHRLSVGQQQRVAVARALLGQPEIVLADEPTSALDADTRDQFLELLFKQAAAQETTILFVSHDAQLATRFHRVLHLAPLNSTTHSLQDYPA